MIMTNQTPSLVITFTINLCIELTTCPSCTSTTTTFHLPKSCPALPHHSTHPNQPWCIKSSETCSTCHPHLHEKALDIYGEEKVPMSPKALGAWRRRLKIFTRLERGLGSSSPRLAGPPPTDRPLHMAIRDDED